MNAFHFLSGPVTDALGWTLLHAIWQGFALVLPIALMLHLLRNKSSMLRYQVSVLTLAAQLLVSAVTFVWYYESAATVSPLRLVSGQMTPVRWQTVAQTLPWHQQMQQFLEAHLSQFVLIYLIGVVLFGVRLAGGWLFLQQISRTATQPTTVIWAPLTDKLQSALSIRAVVQIRESARITVPMVIGVLKPILLLPIGLATHLTTREIEAVLAHELAHIKRHDYGVNLLQSVVEVLYFFHPALWWLSARVREEREHCCDDLAVQVCGGDGRILAQALARVEELRLTQTSQIPVLAMAFASKRQQLLHRVRRMLGVPAQSFVSNSSLAGLTLATILLMSISVYAMQKQETPKPRKNQPHPSHSTRRHSKGNGTEYGMIDNKKVEYVIWKGQKLSAKRVARLQRQLDQVMAGKLSLDNIAQPDRDILLTIIETNQSFDSGMEALGAGLAKIDYNNIVASALSNVPLSPDGTLEGLAKVNYDSIIHTALASTQPLLDSLSKSRAYNQRQMDSLGQLLAQRAKQAEVVRLQMEKLRFPIEEVNRKNDVLNWRKEKLIEQRNILIEKHQRLLRNNDKQKLSQADIEKQVAALEPEIKKLETNVEELNKQFELSTVKQDELKVPIDRLNQEAEQLDEQIKKLSEEIEKQNDAIERMTIERLPLNRSEKESVEYNTDHHTLRVHGPLNIGVGGPTAVPARPVKPAKSAIAPRPSMKAIPSVPVIPASPAGPVVRPPAPPVGPKSLRALPKPALSPTLDTLGKLTVPNKENPAYSNGKFAKLGAIVDSDPTIKTAAFTFNPVEGQAVQVRSVTFIKDKDTETQKSLKP